MMSKPHLRKSRTSFCASLMISPYDGLFEPGGLGRQLPGFLFPHGPHFEIDGGERFGALGVRRRAHTRRLRRPQGPDELQHPCARDLVDAHQHRLARLPPGRAVLHEIGGDALEPLVGRDHLVVLAEQLVEQRLLVRIEVRVIDLVRDAVVQVGQCHPQLVAAVLVDQLDRRAVLLGPLEVVARYVFAEDAPGEFVVLEERRPRESDERRVRQRSAHVSRQPPCLCAVRLVGDHDDVVARAVGAARIDILVELVDQAEDVAVVLLQQPFQVVARCRPWGPLVGDSGADERAVDLAVQVIPCRSSTRT